MSEPSRTLPPPLTVEEARAHILALTRALSAEKRLLTEALGAVLADPVAAPTDSPAFDNSAMDGYAVRWADVADVTETRSVELPVVLDVPAAPAPEGAVGAGQAARIMTGGRLPEGADTVIRREDTDELGERMRVLRLPRVGPGANIRRQGSYFAAGGELLRAGQVVDPGAIGLLASVGITSLNVHRRPRVAIVSTGDELVEIHTRPGPGQIRNSSAYMLAGLVAEAGGRPTLMPIARDTVEHCRAQFQAALAAADMVVSIGGVSVGDYDIVREVMTGLNAEMGFWRVKIKPGKPLAFGLTGGKPLIGLPGNPVSSFVAFWQFVRPALRRLLGFADDGLLDRVSARLTAPVRSPSWRADYQRGELRRGPTGWEFAPQSDQSSGNLTSIVNTSGFAVIPEGVAALAAGELVAVERLPGGPVPPGRGD